MDNSTMATILWIAAGILLVLIVMRRRKRKLLK
jgi:LPXTG-motif cell wall-anchored protein